MACEEAVKEGQAATHIIMSYKSHGARCASIAAAQHHHFHQTTVRHTFFVLYLKLSPAALRVTGAILLLAALDALAIAADNTNSGCRNKRDCYVEHGFMIQEKLIVADTVATCLPAKKTSLTLRY